MAGNSRRIQRSHGRAWLEQPLWLETTPDETGRGLAEAAVAEHVDVVLASGGDGTVTACADGVAGSGVPLAVLPAGTGNLLARNLGLPLGLDAALVVALNGRDRRLDVGNANGHPFVAMAGIGFDAMLLDSTSQRSKSGWAGWPIRCPPCVICGSARRGTLAPTAIGCFAAGPAASSSATWAPCRAAWSCCRARSQTTACSILV